MSKDFTLKAAAAPGLCRALTGAEWNNVVQQIKAKWEVKMTNF